MRVIRGAAAVIMAALSLPAVAGPADVLNAEATLGADGTWDFTVTVGHADEGWEHYADAWEVTTPDGRVLATRVLHHPHVDEQPFTRSLSGIVIPAGIDRVTVRARDSVHGFGGAAVEVTLDR